MTTINLMGIVAITVLGVMQLSLSRKYAPLPLILVGIAVTYGQIIYIAGLHFTILRIVILFGWSRVIIRREINEIGFNTIDKIFITWLLTHILVYIFREQTYAAFINRMGFAYNAAGIYFLFRIWIKDLSDYKIMIQFLALVSIILAGLLVLEYTTGRNIYSIYGGVIETSWNRLGRIRCQGPFRHAILAGTFGATSLPLFLSLYYLGASKILVALSCFAALMIVIMSSSSGPLFSIISVIIGISLWPFRNNMRLIRWGFLISIISLHMIMKAPVWYLISRVSSVIGGAGWHRSELINQAINNVGAWWLYGMSVSETAGWMPYNISISKEQADITNRYISEGVNGGLVTLILFITSIYVCYKSIGNALKNNELTNDSKFVLWCMGVCIFSHLISFISVTYFDQMQIYWYMILASISSIACIIHKNEMHNNIATS